MDATPKIIFSALFSAMLVVPALILAPQLADFDRPKQEHLLNGELTRSLEKYIDDQNILKTFATNLWAAIGYTVFHEGRKGVAIGSRGWLFTNEEIDPIAHADTLYHANLTAINNISDTLKAQGIELVVAIIPAKTRLYRQYLPPEMQPSNIHQALYERIHQDLDKAQIKAPSLLEPMMKANMQHPVFLSTDTHWTPWGAASVAKALSDFIKEQPLVAVDTKTFSTEVIEKKPHQGDLLNYLPLSPWFDFINPFTDTIEVKKTTMHIKDDISHTEAALFADTGIEITLVGSSYSANPLWNFAGALTQHLGADLLNMAKEGEGPLRPIQEYLQSDEFKNHPPKLVIWEFPERYLLKDNTQSEKKTL